MPPKIESLTDLVVLLELALSSREERVSAIEAFQNYIWDTKTPIPGATAEQWDYLDELAGDLDFYEPDPVCRLESFSLYDDQRLETEIVEALRKLREVAPSSNRGDDRAR